MPHQPDDNLLTDEQVFDLIADSEAGAYESYRALAELAGLAELLNGHAAAPTPLPSPDDDVPLMIVIEPSSSDE